MEKIRSFIAIKLPDNVREHLAGISDRIKRECSAPVKWVSMEHMHLTLKFLGDVEAGKIPLVLEALGEAAKGKSSLSLKTAETGGFPSPQRVRIIWAGLEGDVSPLADFQREIEKRLGPLGFPEETRAFTPHLTLGRVKERASSDQQAELGTTIGKYSGLKPVSFTVSAVYLIKSVLTPRGPQYTELGSVRLG